MTKAEEKDHLIRRPQASSRKKGTSWFGGGHLGEEEEGGVSCFLEIELGWEKRRQTTCGYSKQKTPNGKALHLSAHLTRRKEIHSRRGFKSGRETIANGETRLSLKYPKKNNRGRGFSCRQ